MRRRWSQCVTLTRSHWPLPAVEEVPDDKRRNLSRFGELGSKRKRGQSLGRNNGSGTVMSNLQTFLLGVMAALTPSMLVLAAMINRLPTADAASRFANNEPVLFDRKHHA
jgi:hypothetical protein